jgi:hypothetical protein
MRSERKRAPGTKVGLPVNIASGVRVIETLERIAAAERFTREGI